MKLLIAFEVDEGRRLGKGVWECAYWWYCLDDGQHYYEVDPIPAPEYQWLWNCEGIPEEAFVDWPELRQECDEMWAKLPKSLKRRYSR